MRPLLLAAALSLGVRASATSLHVARAPHSGAPFLRAARIRPLPAPGEDAGAENVVSARLKPNSLAKRSPHACDHGAQADENGCLHVEGRNCMWVRMEKYEPPDPNMPPTPPPDDYVPKESRSYCLPCELDGEDIPCWNTGALVGGSWQVTNCAMSCPHQKRLWQPGYACYDGPGFISQAQCYDRGLKSGGKCMFTTYVDSKGMDRGTCGPCQLPGSGRWSCPSRGAAGPEAGSRVTFCASQCDAEADEDDKDNETQAEPTTAAPLTPGVGKTAADPDEMLMAPAILPMQAWRVAAQQGRYGLPSQSSTRPPPKSYFPVVLYRTPGDYAVTTVPPPVWPPVWQWGWPTGAMPAASA